LKLDEVEEERRRLELENRAKEERIRMLESAMAMNEVASNGF